MPSLFNLDLLKKLFKAESRYETNVSELFFTKKFVYKIKKPVDLGFVDFTKPKIRQQMTLIEYRFNKKISPSIYLELIPIKFYKNRINLGGRGKLIEYAIKMVRLPQSGWLANLLEKRKVNRNLIVKLALSVAQMHSKFKPGKTDSKYGKFKVIKKNWDQTLRLIKNDALGIYINKDEFEKLSKVTIYFKKLQPILKQRIKEKRIQTIHGDLHSENIFIKDKKPYITDAILPIDDWIHGDVAIDVAALAMDLDAYGFRDFSDLFVGLYAQKRHDAMIKKVIPFYKIYWAAIRFWVNSLAAKDNKREAMPKVMLYKKILFDYISKI